VALEYLALVGNLTQSSFVANDPYTTAFNEGRRSLVLEVLSLADLGPDDMAFLLRSHERSGGDSGNDDDTGDDGEFF
jgi:hypothetical protein